MSLSCIIMSMLGSSEAIVDRGVPPLDLKSSYAEPFFGIANFLLIALIWRQGLETGRRIFLALCLVCFFPGFAIINLGESRPHPGSHGGWTSVFWSSPLESCVLQSALVLGLFATIHIGRIGLAMSSRCDLTMPPPSSHKISIRDMLVLVTLVAIQCMSFRWIVL